MQKQPWFHTLISLIGAIALLAIAKALDNFLTLRQRFAQASFEYDQVLLAQIVVGVFMVVAWTALGWYCLFSRRPGRGLCIALLILGGFVILAPYAGMWAGLPILQIRLFELITDLVHASGIFIAVLGGLGLVRKPS